MMSTPYFQAEDAVQLPPFGTCASCGMHESPEIAVFWDTDTDGRSLCPKCSGTIPTEGYDCFLLVTRTDRAPGLPAILGPYSPREATRVKAYIEGFENIQSVHIAQKPEWA